MVSEAYSRFLFIGFEDLKKIKFEKLEQVCDKVFVFVNKEEKAIPFSLVQQLQKLGETVQWMPVFGNEQAGFCHFLSFQLGQLHTEVEEDIEFAIISENADIDGLIAYLNEIGRSAVRVTSKKESTQHTSDLQGINWSKKPEQIAESEPEPVAATHHPEKSNGVGIQEQPNPSTVSPQNQQLSERIARETLNRLIMSGNRPAAIDALKSYILLQYNNADVNKNIDLIIRKLERTKEIEVKDKEVVYKF